ncbi:MAG: biotin--[acetyl-CoA-carboxylase] ligase [Paracoccaceae bacterium]
MNSATWPEGYGRRVLASVDSTLDEGRRVAPELSGPEWILALEQTAARGRRGRAWASLDGNFAATLVLPLSEPPAHAALRSFVTSLALREALVGLSGRDDVFKLKWPNDVLLHGQKVAGILLESIGQGSQISHLAIGIGVNLAHAPEIETLEPRALTPAALRPALGVETSPVVFLDTLAQSYARLETQFRTFGFGPIRQAWLAHAARLGEAVVARTSREETQGTFADVDDTGQLVLETPKGRATIPAADVYF